MAEHHDVVIVGAGLSGVGAACHLRARCPRKSVAVLEAREAMGGTWDLFRYPGIRSDSDMFTLGYSFEPWEQPEAIADGPSILAYVRETARGHGVQELIRYGHRVERAEWSSPEARWTVTARREPDGEEVSFTCEVLYMCSGYYRYEEGFTPPLPGRERFGGQIIHPQHWPEDLDYDGRRVVVLGSGATAVTLVPAMAARAAHVTMLQRSPSYIVALPARDRVAEILQRRLPSRAAYALARWKNVLMQLTHFQMSRRRPRLVRALMIAGVRRRLPGGYDVDTHFSPRYDPWDQRVCMVPAGDLMSALHSGRASMVTDRIETFTERGLRLASGSELEADIVITATGLNLQLFGGMSVAVDGEPVDLAETVAYKGMMLSGVPNLVFTLGYTNASWTLKADLVAEYVCRLVNHMDARGLKRFTPLPPPAGTELHPVVDLKSGYVLRSVEDLPKQADRVPWRLHQNYLRDYVMLRRGTLEDEGIEFAPSPRTAERERSLAA